MFGAARNLTALLEKKYGPAGVVNIRRRISQGLFVVSLIPLSLVLRKMKVGYDLGTRKGLINHLLFMDDLKLYGKNEKQVHTLVNTVRIVSKDIVMDFGIGKCAVLL